MKTTTSKRLLRLTGIVLFGVILWNVDLRQSLAALLSADPRPIGFSFVLLFPLVFLKTLRWWFLGRLLGIKTLSIPRANALYWSGILAGTVTPGRIGEFGRAYSLGREHSVPYGHAVATVVFDRVFDAYLLVVLGVLAFWWYEVTPLGDWLLIPLVAVLVGLPLMVLNERLIQRLIRRLCAKGMCGAGPSVCRNPPDTAKGSFVDGMLLMLRPKALAALALTAAAYGAFYLQCYLLSYGLQLPLAWWDVVLMMSVANLVSLIPVTLAGLGTREAALIFFFSRMNLPAESAVSFSLLVLCVFHLGAGGVGLLAWLLGPSVLGRDQRSAT